MRFLVNEPDMRIVEGDSFKVLPQIREASIDAIVCDPPYQLGFMGKTWDQPDFIFHERWAPEALRVLKPGGHLLAFGGTRTYHRLACALEDAGFEIRDCITWLYGSGFPKSLDVSKAIDKAAGAEREVVGKLGGSGYTKANVEQGAQGRETWEWNKLSEEPATEDAVHWQGWGTALKPAFEPIVVARKPLTGTVAANVLRHGTGGLNIDGCRVAAEAGANLDGGRVSTKTEGWDRPWKHDDDAIAAAHERGKDAVAKAESLGRWPANVVLAHHEDCVQVGEREVAADGHWPSARPAGSEIAGASGHAGQEDLAERSARGETVAVWECHPDCPVRMLDEQTGDLTRWFNKPREADGVGHGVVFGKHAGTGAAPVQDAGGASRFFYTAKTSRAERNAGLDHLPASTDHKTTGRGLSNCLGSCPEHGAGLPSGANVYACGCAKVYVGEGSLATYRNHHPTVKPIALMRWLVRLVTPPGGVVLDPFLGSGTTGIAAALEGFRFVGIESVPEYAEIARARIVFWREHGENALAVERRQKKARESGQATLV